MSRLTEASGIVWILLPSSVSANISLFVFLNQTLPQANIFLLLEWENLWVLFILHLNQYKINPVLPITLSFSPVHLSRVSLILLIYTPQSS